MTWFSWSCMHLACSYLGPLHQLFPPQKGRTGSLPMSQTLLGSYVDAIRERLEGSRNLDKEVAGIRVLCLQAKDYREPLAVKDAGWVIFKTPGCGPSASIMDSSSHQVRFTAGGHQHIPLAHSPPEPSMATSLLDLSSRVPQMGLPSTAPF